jgi:hypothetical protein
MFADNRNELQEFANGCKDLQKPIRICKRPQGLTAGGKEPQGTRKDLQNTRKTTSTTAKTIKRIGAIQVFCPRPSNARDLATGEYRLSKKVDSFSLTQDPYFGRPQTFQVATAYKTKANKVCPVDSSDADGSKPGGSLD